MPQSIINTTVLPSREILLNSLEKEFLYLNLYHNSRLLNKVCNLNTVPDGLNRIDFEKLLGAHLLLYYEKNDINTIIEKVLLHFDKSIQQNRINTNSFIRGTIDWPQTIKYRSQTGFLDKSSFAIKSTKPIYDTTINQVVKHILSIIKKYAITISRSARDNVQLAYGVDYSKLIHKIDYFLNNTNLRNVSKIKSLKKDHLIAFRKSRNLHYKKLAPFVDLVYKACYKRDPKILFSIISNTLLAPCDDYTIFELVVLFQVLKTFELLCAKTNYKRRFSLIAKNQDNLFTYQLENFKYDIYYQSVPMNIKRNSKLYSRIRTLYSMKESVLIPDIIIQKKDLNNRVIDNSLIEIKYSASPSYYFGQGIRDLLAYLFDYENALVGPKPNGILVVYPQLSPKKDWASEKIWVLDSHSFFTEFYKYIDVSIKNGGQYL